MKYAILITAYKDFQQLENLVNEFPAEDYNVYIHIDKKSKVDENIISKISNRENVKCIERKYVINWGGLNHLNAFLHLSRIALKDAENRYFHSITAQDFPLKNTDYLNKLLLAEDGPQKGYMEFFPLPAANWKNGGIDRLEYYYLNTYFNHFNKIGGAIIIWAVEFQKKLHIKRKIRFKEKLYGGSTYWTLPRDILQYVIDFTEEKPKIYRRLHNVNVAEEFYFQTVLMNSVHAKNMINDCLRYMDWQNGNDYGPAFLSVENYEDMVNSDKLFARKITIIEKQLLKKLKMQRSVTSTI
ncbi:Core-2/I-Branching enzyme [Kaistella treverensis]|uniref:Peptide O-xylosyltransferase n=1 Tax=Kaistella treverensis TaxID=631455 RepID=A0A1I3LYZ4_9FLAO|nr:beta-1,6-N-acetylglucosaminyltransferase [Kaistella treverensis]SFI89958.1 Core-2/I-Branching enzyme [Kaistella treverensis]